MQNLLRQDDQACRISHFLTKGLSATSRLKGVFFYHTDKCIRRFGGIYAYCRYFIDRKW